MSETVLQPQAPPQLQKYNPVPLRSIFFTGLPQPHLLWSFGSIAQLQSGPQVQASAVLPSIQITWPPAISLPQLHFPGFRETLLHLHSGPQLHQ